MQEKILQLQLLLESLPGSNSARTVSSLDNVLAKYLTLLNYVNGYNDDLKMATSLFYNDISGIRDNIQLCIFSTQPGEKNTAFEAARTHLQRNIEALATLIQARQQETIAVS